MIFVSIFTTPIPVVPCAIFHVEIFCKGATVSCKSRLNHETAEVTDLLSTWVYWPTFHLSELDYEILGYKISDYEISDNM